MCWYLQHGIIVAQSRMMMPATSCTFMCMRQRRWLRRQSCRTKTADRRRFVHRAPQLVLGQLVKIWQGTHRYNYHLATCHFAITRVMLPHARSDPSLDLISRSVNGRHNQNFSYLLVGHLDGRERTFNNKCNSADLFSYESNISYGLQSTKLRISQYKVYLNFSGT